MRSEELRSDTDTDHGATTTPRTRKRAPWRDDFQGSLDRLGAQLGAAVRYQDGALELWSPQGWNALVEQLPDKHAAYWWAQGRAAQEADRG